MECSTRWASGLDWWDVKASERTSSKSLLTCTCTCPRGYPTRRSRIGPEATPVHSGWAPGLRRPSVCTWRPSGDTKVQPKGPNRYTLREGRYTPVPSSVLMDSPVACPQARGDAGSTTPSGSGGGRRSPGKTVPPRRVVSACWSVHSPDAPVWFRAYWLALELASSNPPPAIYRR